MKTLRKFLIANFSIAALHAARRIGVSHHRLQRTENRQAGGAQFGAVRKRDLAQDFFAAAG